MPEKLESQKAEEKVNILCQDSSQDSSMDKQAENTISEKQENKFPEIKPAPNSAVGIILGENFDLLTAVGGIRGIIESVLPTIIFLIGFTIMHDYLIPSFVAIIFCALFILLRIIQKIPISPALGGFFAMIISIIFAWRTGEASNIFLWGILLNSGYFAILAISALVKRPLIGVLIALFKGDGMRWRKSNYQPIIRNCYYRLTWLWAAVFALRLIVQLPLYFADATASLGVAKLVMGMPLFALALWLSWMIYRGALKSADTSDA